MNETQTFLFADLAGFTALTETHGDDAAADLACEFPEWIDGLLPDYGAERIKAIGDAVMLRCDRADRAVGLGLRIAGDFGARHGFPTIRVDAAGAIEAVAFHARGEREFQNVTEALSIFAATVSEDIAAVELPIDPVCRMVVDPARRAGRLSFEGVDYEFCALECAQKFAADPARYVQGDTGSAR